jgi:hypothetical protein
MVGGSSVLMKPTISGFKLEAEVIYSSETGEYLPDYASCNPVYRALDISDMN